LRLRANPGPLKISYQAEVDIRHHVDRPEKIGEMPIAELPTEVLAYLYPSRYCESDKLQQLANQTFGHLRPGYRRVEGIRKWVQKRTRFTSGSSNFTTSAIDTYQQQVGVCRDFAHLMIDYVPGEWIVESKSLKNYLAAFRNHGAFHEACTLDIAQRLMGLLTPHWLRIGGYWYPRGGIPIEVFWQIGAPPEAVWIPAQEVQPYRGRG
jgi:7-cyano-7-deazaguanine reductase